MKAVSALDFAFPEEVSLLGFEDSEWMTALRPYLSTVRQSVVDLAQRSWMTLVDRMADEKMELRRVMLAFDFAFRKSTRPPAAPYQNDPPLAQAALP